MDVLAGLEATTDGAGGRPGGAGGHDRRSRWTSWRGWRPRQTGPVDVLAGLEDVLAGLEAFYDASEQVAPDVDGQLAKIVGNLCDTKLADDKLKEKMAAYVRPGNYQLATVPGKSPNLQSWGGEQVSKYYVPACPGRQAKCGPYVAFWEVLRSIQSDKNFLCIIFVMYHKICLCKI